MMIRLLLVYMRLQVDVYKVMTIYRKHSSITARRSQALPTTISSSSPHVLVDVSRD